MAFNYDAIMKRANKIIDKVASMGTSSTIHFITIDDSIENLNGLVVIAHPDYQKPEQHLEKDG